MARNNTGLNVNIHVPFTGHFGQVRSSDLYARLKPHLFGDADEKVQIVGAQPRERSGFAPDPEPAPFVDVPARMVSAGAQIEIEVIELKGEVPVAKVTVPVTLHLSIDELSLLLDGVAPDSIAADVDQITEIL